MAALGVVQAIYWLNNGTSNPAITTTAGNLLVYIGAGFASIGATPISDSKSNSWTQAIAPFGTSQGFVTVLYAQNCLGGASHTFTVAGASFPTNIVLEISGAALTGALNTSVTSVAATTVHSAGPLTANATVPEIMIGGGSVGSGSPTTPTNALTPLNGFGTLLLQGFGSVEGLAIMYTVVGPSVARTSSYTAAAINEAAFIVGFKAAAVAAGGAGGSYTFFGA